MGKHNWENSFVDTKGAKFSFWRRNRNGKIVIIDDWYSHSWWHEKDIPKLIQEIKEEYPRLKNIIVLQLTQVVHQEVVV